MRISPAAEQGCRDSARGFMFISLITHSCVPFPGAGRSGAGLGSSGSAACSLPRRNPPAKFHAPVPHPQGRRRGRSERQSAAPRAVRAAALGTELGDPPHPPAGFCFEPAPGFVFRALKCIKHSPAFCVVPLLSLGFEKCWFYTRLPHFRRVLSGPARSPRSSPGDPSLRVAAGAALAQRLRVLAAIPHPKISPGMCQPPPNPIPLSAGLRGLSQPGIRVRGCRRPRR